MIWQRSIWLLLLCNSMAFARIIQMPEQALPNKMAFKGWQLNMLPGFLIAHREYMANMEAHTLGLELQYSSNHTGWHSADHNYKHLQWGTGLSYFYMGNPSLNGSALAWHINIEANLKQRQHFHSAVRIGSGIGYLSKPYDLNTNKMNKAIGSHFNGNMQLMYKAYFDLTPKSALVLGLGVTHYSNGNFRRPNLGINMAHLSVGYLQKVKLSDQFRSRQLPDLFPKPGFEWMIGYARKQYAVADTRFFNIISSSLLYYHPHNNKGNWRMGIETFFDKTYPYSTFNTAALNNVPLKEMTEIAAKVGHEFMFGRIGVVTDLGTYLTRPNQYKKAVYFAIGFNYCFNRGWIAQTRLKSHMAVADYFYWGVAKRFNSPIHF